MTLLINELSSEIPSVVVEIMNTIMTMFPTEEKRYYSAFVEGELLMELKRMLPELKEVLKRINGKLDAELRKRADEVLQNFLAFL